MVWWQGSYAAVTLSAVMASAALCVCMAWTRRGEQTGSTSEVAGSGHRGGHDNLTNGDNTGVWLPPGASGLTVVDHDGSVELAIRPNLKHLTAPFLPLLNPKPWRVSKRYINKSCRAIGKLQLCFRE